MTQYDADQLKKWVSEIETATLWRLIVWLIKEWLYRMSTSARSGRG